MNKIPINEWGDAQILKMISGRGHLLSELRFNFIKLKEELEQIKTEMRICRAELREAELEKERRGIKFKLD